MKVQVKSRRPKPAARRKKFIRFAADIVSAILSGLATAAIVKWLGW